MVSSGSVDARQCCPTPIFSKYLINNVINKQLILLIIEHCQYTISRGTPSSFCRCWCRYICWKTPIVFYTTRIDSCECSLNSKHGCSSVWTMKIISAAQWIFLKHPCTFWFDWSITSSISSLVLAPHFPCFCFNCLMSVIYLLILSPIFLPLPFSILIRPGILLCD